jgi:hypothetical protein
MIITESGWNLPHRYMAEGPFLVAAYQSLTGLDGYYWFSADAVSYKENPYFDFTRNADGKRAMHRWTCSVPGMLGQFPANALMYRMSYVKQAEPALYEEKPLSSLWNRDLSPLAEEQNYDPNRDDHFTFSSNQTGSLSPFTYLTGPVEVLYGGKKENTRVNPNLSRLIDPGKKLITSSTGELCWNYGDGVCTLNAPKARGVCGFVNLQKEYRLGELIIRSPNSYAAILVVSMDDKPLEESSRMLVQVGTTYQPTGWQEEECDFTREKQLIHGYRITNTGHMPWKAAETRVQVELNNSLVNRAVLLDAAGYIVKSIPVKKSGKQIKLDFPREAMYVLLETSRSAEHAMR